MSTNADQPMTLYHDDLPGILELLQQIVEGGWTRRFTTQHLKTWYKNITVGATAESNLVIYFHDKPYDCCVILTYKQLDTGNLQLAVWFDTPGRVGEGISSVNLYPAMLKPVVPAT